MWSGATAPSGWSICDGSNGTPNLQDKFVISRGSVYAQGTQGGSATKTLGTENLPSHTHTTGTLAASGGSHSHNFSATGTNTHSHDFNGVTNDDHNDTARKAIVVRNDSASYNNATGGSGVQNASITVSMSGTTDPSGNLSLGVSGNTGDQGGTLGQSFDILPPYYALAYIMRIS